jgi:hypothetical protein
MAEDLAHHVKLGAFPDMMVAKVWRSAWVEASGMLASPRYSATILRMERVPSGFSNLVRKSRLSSTVTDANVGGQGPPGHRGHTLVSES